LIEILRLLVLRNFREEPVRSFLTAVGVALGVALVVSVQVANHAALESFRDSIDRVAGRATLAVTSHGSDFDENLLATLAPTRGFGQMFPVVEGRLALAAAPKESLLLLGVDLMRDRQVRTIQVTGPDGRAPGRAEFLENLAHPDRLFLPQSFAQAHGLKAGDRADFIANGRVVSLQVAGLLSGDGVGGAYAGQLAVMDIAAAQHQLGLEGRLTRIEWIPRHEGDQENLAQAIRKNLPTDVELEAPAARNDQVDKMLKAFRANLTALSLVSLLVGAFLAYNSMSIAVLRRVREIGTLRTLGVTATQVRRLLLAESSILAGVGTLSGLYLGKAAGWAVTRAVGTTISNLYLPTPLGDRIPASAGEWVWALAGFLLIVLSTVPVARAASRVAPGLAVRAGSGEAGFQRQAWVWAGVGAGLWVAAALLARLPAIGGLPWGGYASAFCLLTGAAALTPIFLWVTQRAAKPVFERLFPVEAVMASRNLLSGLNRSSLAVGALVMGAALMVSVGIMVGSFRSTVELWIGQTLKADLYVRSGPPSARFESFLDPEVVEKAKGLDSVAAVDAFRGFDYDYQGDQVLVGSGDSKVLAEYGRLLFTDGRESKLVLERLPGRLAAVASEPLANRFHLKVGDFFPLRTPSGEVPLEIAGIYYDYANERGTLVMDRGTYLSLYHDPRVNNLAIYLKPGVGAETGRQALMAALGSSEQLFIRSNGELRREVLKIFDQTFAITGAMELIALVVAVLGILATLTALIIERSTEIAILRYVGATRFQVQAMVVWEAGLLGSLGCALGAGVGGVLALLLIKVINLQSFGWTIRLMLPWSFLVSSLGLVGMATLLAGFYPARVASRMATQRAVSEE